MNLIRYQSILSELKRYNAHLVAVSKTQSQAAILELYQQGQRDFGENRVQELTPKQEALPKDIRWHLIGHLQRNKVKYIAAFVQMIHSIDGLELLQEVNKQAIKHNRTIDCLLQFHVAQEETKFGLEEAEARILLGSSEFQQLKNIRIRGIMGMASLSPNREQVQAEFRQLKAIFERLRQDFFKENPDFNELSMGMSGDYPLALEEGSTILRIGSLLFSE